MQTKIDDVLLPHVGWMRYEAGDAVARYLRQGWFESEEQAFVWLYLRAGDVVVDCGAHAGLFTVLAGRIVGERGRVVSVEPSPVTAGLLRENVEAHGLGGISTVLECAAGRGEGRLTLVDEGDGKSAFNHLEAGAEGGRSVAVESLETLLARVGVGRVDFLKLDVEGAEFDVWAGARELIERGMLPVVMVEFTEANLRRSGRGTEDLYREIEGSGYALHRFDAGSGQLVRRPLEGPIWYENLFAVRGEDVGVVNERLRGADAERRRVAWDVVQRGIAGVSARDGDERLKRIGELEAERDWLTRERDRVAVQGDRLMEERDRAAAELEALRKEFEEEKGRAAQQLSRVETSLEEASRTVRRLEGELAAVIEERTKLAARNEEVLGKLSATAAAAGRDRARLRSFCVSKYERVSWAVGIRRKPEWVDEVVADGRGPGGDRRS